VVVEQEPTVQGLLLSQEHNDAPETPFGKTLVMRMIVRRMGVIFAIQLPIYDNEEN